MICNEKASIRKLSPLFARYSKVLAIHNQYGMAVRNSCREAGFGYSTFKNSVYICELKIVAPDEFQRLLEVFLEDNESESDTSSRVKDLNKSCKRLMQEAR